MTTLFNEYEISKWAYFYCKNSEEDNIEIRKLITDSEWAYYYCKYIEDNPEVRQFITNPFYVSFYEILKYRKSIKGDIKNEY